MCVIKADVSDGIWRWGECEGSLRCLCEKSEEEQLCAFAVIS